MNNYKMGLIALLLCTSIFAIPISINITNNVPDGDEYITELLPETIEEGETDPITDDDTDSDPDDELLDELPKKSQVDPEEEEEGEPEEDEEINKKTVPTITANITLRPKAVNFRSRGRWIRVTIELPVEYDVHSILFDTILLNGTISPEEGYAIFGDHDDDGIPDLSIKFNRSLVLELCKNAEDKIVEIEISGDLGNGKSFEGTNTIRLIHYRPNGCNYNSNRRMNWFRRYRQCHPVLFSDL